VRRVGRPPFSAAPRPPTQEFSQGPARPRPNFHAYDAALAIRRTRRGLLEGHVVIGYQLVRKHGLLSKLAPELLERIVARNAHEFSEYQPGLKARLIVTNPRG